MIPSSNADLEQRAVSLIRDCAFSPAIALLTSYDVEVVCEKNNLSFCELLLPFTQLSIEAVVKDPNNQNIIIRNLNLDFRDLRRDGYLSNAALPVALGELLRQCQSSSAVISDGGSIISEEESGGETTTSKRKQNGGGGGIDTNTPWYDSYTRYFLRLLDPPEYEFNRHYLACILVVSTCHDDPLDQFNRLSSAQHQQQHQQQTAAPTVQLPKHAASPKWFSPNTFKYHLLVHDVAAGDERKAESIYQGMKMNYGAHACHLLRINSAAASPSVESGGGSSSIVSPNIWTPFLRHRLRRFNNLRFHEDEYAQEDNTNNNNGGTPPATVINGDTVLVGDDATEQTTIPHPLSCGDLENLGRQQLQNEVTTVEKEERIQLPTAYGQCLTPSDTDRIKIFVQEFSVRGLLPYVERQLRLLNEQVVARRGLHKTFLSFTKNLWGKTGTGVGGGSTPNLQNMAISGSSSGTFGYAASASASDLPSPERAAGSAGGVIAQPTITYPYESPEMQTRRLADLAALFRIYDLAYQLYHSLKKEFATAQAWIHSASAMEFASLCVYLAGPGQSRPYPSHYMDQAINTYLAVSGNSLLAARASIYSTVILCATADYGQAAAQYIRLSSGDDLRSALFLEQAAFCFVRAGLKRKAALHLILAGHRYGKAGKRQHTIRCYEKALKSYYGKGWRYALDHIFSTLGDESQRASSLATEPSSFLLRRRQQQQQQQQHSDASGVGTWLPKQRGGNEFSLDTSTTDAKYSTTGAADRQDAAAKVTPISNLINFNLIFPPMLEHDFHTNGLCRIVVGLEVTYSAQEVEEISVRTYSGAMAPPGEFQQFYRGYPLLCWSSGCRRTRLCPSESGDPGTSSNDGTVYRHRLDLYAVVASPGIFDVSSLKVSCRRRHKDNTNMNCWEELSPLQSQFITVIQSPNILLEHSRVIASGGGDQEMKAAADDLYTTIS